MDKMYRFLLSFFLRSFWIATSLALPNLVWGEGEGEERHDEDLAAAGTPAAGSPATVSPNTPSGDGGFNSVFGKLNPQNVGDCLRGFSIPGRTIPSIDKKLFSRIVLAYARNVCESKNPSSNFNKTGINGKIGEVPCMGDSRACGDTLAYYGAQSSDGPISSLDLSKNPINTGTNNAKITYSILFQLGMIESDGKEKTGKDDSNPAENSELTRSAGLFQTSMNSKGFLGNSTGVFEALLRMHEQKCPGVRQMGYEQQMKECPDLAVDYMAALARRTYFHNGPVKNRYAQPRQSCMDVLSEVEGLMGSNEGCSSIANVSIANDSGSGYQAAPGSTNNGQWARPPGYDPSSMNPHNIPESEMYRYQGENERNDKNLFPNGFPGSSESGGSGGGGSGSGSGIQVPNQNSAETPTPQAPSPVQGGSDTGEFKAPPTTGGLAPAHDEVLQWGASQQAAVAAAAEAAAAAERVKQLEAAASQGKKTVKVKMRKGTRGSREENSAVEMSIEDAAKNAGKIIEIIDE